MMKRHLFWLICLSLFIFSCNTTSQKPQEKKKEEEMPDFGTHLSMEGGGMEMTLDTITPLTNLIERLNGDWEFIETGKGYWIGYTNDMYSIASYRNEAIPLLIDFFKETKSPKGKIGALYTLHLIGINGRIAGRIVENFINTKARCALLELLNNKEYAYTVMQLLMRDPWRSDVSFLFEILKTETDIDIVYPIINSLSRYKIENLPVNNFVPDSINKISVKLIVKNNEVLEPDFESQIKKALKKFEKKHPKAIKVEKELYEQTISEHYITKLPDDLTISYFLQRLGIEQGDVSKYIHIGYKIQYRVENNILFFMTIGTAQEILNNWWSNLSMMSIIY